MIINTLRPVTRSINPSIAVGFFLPTVFSIGDAEKRIAGGGNRRTLGSNKKPRAVAGLNKPTDPGRVDQIYENPPFGFIS